jgi:hypothetical protein
MEILSFAAIAVCLIGGATLLAWLIGRTDRNTGSEHGDGYSGCGTYM